MGTIDDLLKYDVGEKELDLDSNFKELPVGKWVVLQAKARDESGASAVQPPDPKFSRDWYSFRLGMSVVGAEEGVTPGMFGGVFHNLNLDSKEAKGVPSPKLKAMINMFFGQGLEHGSPERLDAARKVLNEVAQKFEMDAGLADSDGNAIYSDPAVFLGAVFAQALGDRTPRIIAKPYLKKGRAYTDRDTGEQKTSKERIELGNWTEYTPENMDKLGCVVFPGMDTPF